MRRIHQHLFSLLLLLVAAVPVSAQFASTKPTHEAMTLDLDSTVTKRLASIEALLAEKQWDVVATLLRQTQAEKFGKLIAIAPGWYVSVGRYCQCQAALLPTPALEAYRQQVDATAKKWIEDAERLSVSDPSGQREAWLQVIRRGFASSLADEALARLAEQSFERADYAAARTYWELLLPASSSLRSAAGLGLLRSPDANCDVAQIRAQLILCSLFSGEITRARRELAIFRKLHAEAVGRIAGRDGLLVDRLSSITETPVAIEQPSIASPPASQRHWTVELPIPSASEVGVIAPVIIGETLFATNGDTVFAFDAATGLPKWSDSTDSPSGVHAAVVHSLADPVPSKLPIDGRPRHSLSVSSDRLYARLGTSITGKAKQELSAHSELIGLDIGVGEGKLFWRVSAEEIDRQDPLSAATPWCFEGPPVANSRQVFVAMRRSLPQEQINVACFDADTARLMWNRKVGITVASTRESVNSTSQLQLAVAEDSVFLSTDAGGVAALDAHDGAIRWLRTYESDAISASESGRRDGHTPPIYHDGVVYVAPLDTNLLMAIHAESGLLLWQREWPDPLQFILGVARDTLIVQGRNLWGVILETGEPAWPCRRIGSDDPEGSSFGRGTIVGDEAWWPNQDELVVVDGHSGQITRRIAIRQSRGLTGGHLASFGKLIVMSHDRQLTVMTSDR